MSDARTLKEILGVTKKNIDRAKIEDTFIIRNDVINNKMYVQRDWYEKQLIQRLSSGTHIAIHGESGIGKTWLYKKVLKENDFVFYTCNCGSLAQDQSFINFIINGVVDLNEAVITKSTLTGTSELTILIAKGGLKGEDTYERINTDKSKWLSNYIKEKIARKIP